MRVNLSTKRLIVYRLFDKIDLLKETEVIKMNLESFDSYEKNIIQKAIDKGLPIEKYLNPKFSIWTIKYLIAVLEEDDNLEDFPFDKYNDKQIQVLLYCIYRGKEWKSWAEPNMNYRIMDLFYFSKNTQKLLYFYKRGFKLIELHQIDKFINDGFDPKIIDNLDFDFRQMREIRKALRSGISITKLANPNLTWKEIRARRIKAYGIKKGIKFYIEHYKEL